MVSFLTTLIGGVILSRGLGYTAQLRMKIKTTIIPIPLYREEIFIAYPNFALLFIRVLQLKDSKFMLPNKRSG